MRRVAALAVLFGAAGGACGGGTAAAPDAGVDAAIAVPAPPAPPMRALLTPCPSGWREVPPATADDVATCDPWPVGGEQACAPDEAHFPGEAGCARIGSACPAGEWPEGLPAGQPILYVRAGGAPGGDGSQALPFGTIAEAMTAAPAGAIVALGMGTFDEAVTIAGGVTLWGACVAGTRVASTAAATTAGTITTVAAGAQLRNLSVGGDRPGILLQTAGASLHLEDVLVADAQTAGWYVGSGAQASGHTVVVRDTRAATDLRFGRGCDFVLGAQVTLSRAVVAGNRDRGVRITGAGTTVALTDVAVTDTLGALSGTPRGHGLNAQSGAHVELTRVVLERNLEVGAAFVDADTMVTAADLVVRDTLLSVGGLFGRSLIVQTGAQVDATRVLFERNRDAAAYASDAGTVVTMTDLVVRDTQGAGFAVQAGAVVELSRALIERNASAGALVSGPASVFRAVDLMLRDTASQASDGLVGRGINAQDGALVEVTRGVLERNHDIAVFGSDVGTVVNLTDVVVRDTESRTADGAFGRGLDAQDGAQFTVTRALLERNRDVGVFAAHAGTLVQLLDAVISDTRAQACATAGSCEWEMPAGLGAYEGGAISASRFLVTTSALCGLQLATGGVIDLQDGEVSACPIGANVQTVDFDVGRLQTRVLFRDNDLNLDASGLPLPLPAP